MKHGLPYYELLMNNREDWQQFKVDIINAGSYADSEMESQLKASVFMHGELPQAQLFKLSHESLKRISENPHAPATYDLALTGVPYYNCYFEIPEDYPFVIANHAHGEAATARAFQVIVREGQMLVGVWVVEDAKGEDELWSQMARAQGHKPKAVLGSIHNIAYSSKLDASTYTHENVSHPVALFPLAVASYVFAGDTYYINKKKGHRVEQRNGHHKKKRYWYYYFNRNVAPPWEPSQYTGTPQDETYWVRGCMRKYFYCPLCGKNQSIKEVLTYRKCLKCGAEVGGQDKWSVHYRPHPTYARGPEREALVAGLIEARQKKHAVCHEHPHRQEVEKKDRALDMALGGVR